MAYAVKFSSYLNDNQNIVIPVSVQNEVHAKRKVTIIILEDENQEPVVKKKRQLGILKGQFSISDDFDEPLDDLKEYMF